MFKHQDMQARGEVKLKFHLPPSLSYLQVSGLIHAPTALVPRQQLVASGWISSALKINHIT